MRVRWSVGALALVAGCGTSSRGRGGAEHGTGGAAGQGALAAAAEASAGAGEAGLERREARQRPPGFGGATAWLNVERPLELDQLKGRVVVVDFWTSCCINCIQTLPTLKALEARYANEPVAVIGVHSPKFEAEQEAERLGSILGAYDVRHPVAVDANMAVWRGWGARAWPTVAVLDVEGRVAWADAGEPDAAELDAVVRALLDEGRRSGALARGPLPGLKPPAGPATPLAFPGKVAPLADGGLAVADTGHHRVVLLGPGGAVTAVVGSGLEGALDGGYAEASFRAPQGLAQRGDTLYVADAENHLVRAVDLKARRVTTLAGTGELGRGFLGPEPAPARAQGLRSPWDVLAAGDRLFVALAGSHQVGVVDLKTGQISAFAGSGREERRDGEAAEAAFAQPSALATDGKALYVLDSETSSVRAVDLGSRRVRTVVGKGLFDFGDVDGDRERARLQHPLGLAFAGGALWVADTYNNKVKRVDPATGLVRTAAGGGRGELFEPGGLAARRGELVVADTHHHRLVRLPLGPGGRPEPVAVAGLAAPARGVAVAAANGGGGAGEPEVRVRWRVEAGRPSEVRLAFATPAGTAINEEAPLRLRWQKGENVTVPADYKATGREGKGGVPVTLAPEAGASAASLEGVLDLVLCDEATHKVCVPVRRNVRAEVAVGGAAEREAVVALPEAKP
jgi:thiol-disulfide isomerase/thioredoxin/sugar lactone lactonase YvrE